MDNWEHLALSVQRQYAGTMDEPTSDWVLKLEDGTQLIGLEAILDRYGSKGWELVSTLAVGWNKTDVQELTVIFKRRKSA